MSRVAQFPAPAGGPSVLRRLVGFARFLRHEGFAIGQQERLDALAFARGADLSDPGGLRRGLRALLCGSPADWRRYDELFDAYWLRQGMRRAAPSPGAGGEPSFDTSRQARGDGHPLAPSRIERRGGAGIAEGEGRRQGASAAENLAKVDLRHVEDREELARLHELSERLATRMKQRLTRRYAASRRGRRLDLRTTIHRSIAYGGMPMRLAFRRRRPRPLRLVVILDASGSMSHYSAFFVRFMHGVLDRFREAEAFVFHTRLIHLSPALRERNIERAIQRLTLLASGWSGGTKIGACLAEFNRHHAPRVLNDRSVVMIISDGYDTGPPEALSREMARIKRRCKRLVWLNPMIGWQDYEPVAGGMAAALPHIDLFAPAHNLESLLALEPYVCRL